MKLRHYYLSLAVIGLLLPYWQFVPWLLTHGLNFPLFVRELFANRIGAFFGMDVLVSATVLIFFIVAEGRRVLMRGLWLPMTAIFFVGVSLALPLFLYLRELHFNRSAS